MATSLAPELLEWIFQNSSKDNLKNARLTCRTFEQAASRYLFDTVYISTDQVDRQVATKVIQRFAQFLRTLVYSSTYYAHLSNYDYPHECKNKDWRHNRLHLILSHTDYLKRRISQQVEFKSHEHSVLIAYAFGAAPNLRNVIITDTPTTRATPNELLDGFHSRGIMDACTVEGCTLTSEEHRQFEPDAVSCFALTGYKPPEDPWKPVLAGMWATGAKIQDIVMKPGAEMNGVCMSRFQIAQRQLLDARVTFRNLTRLELFLTFGTSDGIPKMLEMSLNLERLSVKVVARPLRVKYVTPFEAILGNAKLHKLRHLKLTSFMAPEATLLQFLRHSNRLQHFSLHDHYLDEGCWETFAEQSKQLLPDLKRVELFGIYGLVNQKDTVKSEPELTDDEVNDFYFRGGQNPFALSTEGV